MEGPYKYSNSSDAEFFKYSSMFQPHMKGGDFELVHWTVAK